MPLPSPPCPECGRPPHDPEPTPLATRRTFLRFALLFLLLVIAAQAFHTYTYPDISRGRFPSQPLEERTPLLRIVAQSSPTQDVYVVDRRVSGRWPVIQYGYLTGGMAASDLFTITDRRFFYEWRNGDTLCELDFVRPHAIVCLLIHPYRILWTILAILIAAGLTQIATIFAHRRREARRLARGECRHCRYPLRALSASSG